MRIFLLYTTTSAMSTNTRKRKFIPDNEGIDMERQQVKRRRFERKNDVYLPQQPPQNTLFNDTDLLNSMIHYSMEDDIKIYNEVIQPITTSECRMYMEGASHIHLQLTDIEEEIYVHNVLACDCQQNGDCYHYGKKGRHYFHKHVVYMQLRTGYYNHGYKQIMEHLELQLDDGGIQFDEDHIDIIGKTCDLCDHYKCICSLLKREFAEHAFWC